MALLYKTFIIIIIIVVVLYRMLCKHAEECTIFDEDDLRNMYGYILTYSKLQRETL